MPKSTERRRDTSGGKRRSKAADRVFDCSKFEPSMIASDGRPALVEELTTYRDRLPELLKREGAYVVIKGQVYEMLKDRDAALRYAVQNYGVTAALVKKIVAKEPFHGLGGAVL